MCTVLIHEPEAIISLDLSRLLNKHSILTSKSIRTLSEHLKNKNFDVIIIDICRMRGGRHLIKFLLGSNKPVIVLTSDPKSLSEYAKFSNLRIIDVPYNYLEIVSSVESFKGQGRNGIN